MAIFGNRPLLVTVFGCVVDRASISLSIMIIASKLSISTKLLILAGALRNKCGTRWSSEYNETPEVDLKEYGSVRNVSQMLRMGRQIEV